MPGSSARPPGGSFTPAPPRFGAWAHAAAPALALALVLVTAAASPALGQWTRVTALPATQMFSLFAHADTIVAGADTATWASIDGGQTWQRSARPAPAVQVVDALWFRDGRLFAGTFGQGVFASDDLGATWQPYNEGLVGGILNSQLDVGTLQARGDSLYAATYGAGVYVRGFAPGSAWSHFGDVFEPEQASNVLDLALGGVRLVASAGGNGTVFFRDPGAPDWTESFLVNGGLDPGRTAFAAAWTGRGWIVGADNGAFTSPTAAAPWTDVPLGLGSLTQVALAVRDGRAFAAFVTANDAFMETSGDDGASWQLLEDLPHAFVFRLAVRGATLYAARADGLWSRPVGDVAAPPTPAAGNGLAFALLGAQPVRGEARLSFALPEAGPVAIDVFDVRGRRAGARVAGTFGAGPQVVTWSPRGLAPGVYAARLVAAGRSAVARIVLTR